MGSEFIHSVLDIKLQLMLEPRWFVELYFKVEISLKRVMNLKRKMVGSVLLIALL